MKKKLIWKKYLTNVEYHELTESSIFSFYFFIMLIYMRALCYVILCIIYIENLQIARATWIDFKFIFFFLWIFTADLNICKTISIQKMEKKQTFRLRWSKRKYFLVYYCIAINVSEKFFFREVFRQKNVVKRMHSLDAYYH